MKVVATSVFLVAVSLQLSCKLQELGSGTASLTQEEKEFCSFKGKRMMITVAPDFPQDAQIAREIFRDTTQTFLVSHSYIGEKFKGNPEKLQACKGNLDRLGKYQIEASLEPNNATSQNFYDELQRLRRKIIDERSRMEAGGEIQIMLAFTSHGNRTDDLSAGTLVFSDKQVPFNEVAREIYNNLLTHEERNNKGVFEEIKLADEVLIFMDNCFSGNFNQQMKQFLGQMNYPSIEAVPSIATRVISFTASNAGQTAPGGMGQGANAGVLMSALKETLNSYAGDYNKDGALSIVEFSRFLVEYSSENGGEQSESQVEGQTADLICGSLEERMSIVDHIRKNQNYFQSFWENPRESLRHGADMAGNGIVLAPRTLTPTFFSNLDSKLAGSLAIAITKAGNHQTPAGLSDLKEKIALGKYHENEIVRLSSIQSQAYTIVTSKPDTYLKASGQGQADPNQLTPDSNSDSFNNNSYTDPADASNSEVNKVRFGTSTMPGGSYGAPFGQGSQGGQKPRTTVAAIEDSDLRLNDQVDKLIYQRVRKVCQDRSLGSADAGMGGYSDPYSSNNAWHSNNAQQQSQFGPTGFGQ